jgi:hypothetical protein
MERRRTVRNWLIVGGLALVSLGAFFLINYLSGNRSSSSNTPTPEQLIGEIQQLESVILEIELLNEEQGKENTELESLLDQKYDQIAFLEKQIEALEREGRTDKATIQELRDKLAGARAVLLERYKAEINELVLDNSRLTRTLDSLVISAGGSDSLVREASSQRDIFKAALEDCQGKKRGSASLEEVKETVPIWTVADYSFISSKSGEEHNMIPRIETKKIGTMKFCFSLRGNDLIGSGDKTLYFIVENPVNRKAYTSTQFQSGVVNVEGKETLYTHKAIVKYNKNEKANTCFEFVPQQEVLAGNTYFKVVCDGQVIGQQKFYVVPK